MKHLRKNVDFFSAVQHGMKSRTTHQSGGRSPTLVIVDYIVRRCVADRERVYIPEIVRSNITGSSSEANSSEPVLLLDSHRDVHHLRQRKVHRPGTTAAAAVFVALVGKLMPCFPAGTLGGDVDAGLRLLACTTAASLCYFGAINERNMNVAVRIYQDSNHESPEGVVVPNPSEFAWGTVLAVAGMYFGSSAAPHVARGLSQKERAQWKELQSLVCLTMIR